ncbi:DeoR/GlpR family DNA-binding transcription regulator [Clostridium sp. 'White wine YQ']|uniref:DeoR/GlpR family DNA-binding transcription regulator n=1 Tax=Clostridium sp. 'White wine YQ' TaxID=3027474 RepID=UPI002366CED9|nr:DeoR/GlpR family DNA-binding transcription regulator [Clostridium sp. 'White wine YQ']MDD7794483.1 DeoR/GlpR family DNA-binding transcription regulator [Clostridium sp. 'White wine YQ']
MYQEERLLKILEYLNEHRKMSVHDICETLNVSRDTARRDIIKLIEQGTAIRTHGGIAIPAIRNTIKVYGERLKSYSEGKKSIAKRALPFIHYKEHYFFDVSTTISFLAEYLNEEVTVVTHSLDNIEVLSEKENVKVYSTGGYLNRDNRFFYGPDSIRYFKNMLFDAVFLGAAAIMENGIYYVDEEDACIKSAVVKRSSKVIVLAEYEKFSLSSYHKGVDLDEIDIIITDKIPPKNFLEIIESKNIEVIVI